MTAQALSILNNTFGYEAFRGQQASIIHDVSIGKDVLVLMPTGGGKSLCYQIPALIRDGVGIVISPLIALMQDQVDALKQLGIEAAFLNSSQTHETQREIEAQLLQGEIDILYVAPERLTQSYTIDFFKRLPISLFAIDEAHCVSQWGHDFRADYLQLSLLAEHFPAVPRIALTATADQRTQTEIISRLQLEDGEHYVSGFDRPNIQYRITQKSNNARQQLLKFIRQEHDGDTGIIYCLSRKKVESTAEWLMQQGLNALPYHAGLSPELRQHHQQRFLREDNIIIVATIAFGMGIDKPDVRFVAHLDLPKSIEAYYQETGRAGRDGEASTAWMSYGLQDVIKLRQMLENSEGSEDHKRAERYKLDAMLGLCEITSCRRQALLNYFGEAGPEKCNNCDSCLNPSETWDGTVAAQKALSCAYRTGQRFGVNHLIDVLKGAETEKIFQHDHNQVSTYGIGKELDAAQWRSVYRQLVARGFLQVDISGYGGLLLTEKSRPLLKGQESISLRKDVSDKAQSHKKSKPYIHDDDKSLWEALRACRKRLADENNVPPYVIFHDATLMEMMNLRPTSEQQMLSISGIGQSKMENYGWEFIKTIEDYEAEHYSAPKPSDSAYDIKSLFFAGHDVRDIASQLDLNMHQVYSTLAEVIRDNDATLDEVLLIPEQEINLIKDTFIEYDATEGSKHFKSINEAIGKSYPFGLLKCIQADL